VKIEEERRLCAIRHRRKDNFKLCLKELERAFGDWMELTQDRKNCRALENVNILSCVVEFCDHVTELHLAKEECVNGLLSVTNRFCRKFQYIQYSYGT